MKRTSAIALLALSCLGVAGRALAQEPAVQANVPFQFTVGGKLLPADTYTITPSSERVLVIRSTDGHFASMTTITHADSQPSSGNKLVFEKYGNRYFLHEVRCSNYSSMNANIPASKQEKSALEEAKLGQAETVLIAAR